MEINLTNKAVFVLHVKKGYEDREQHIKAMLQKMNIPFSWILDGDIADLTPEILDKYFAGDMHKAGATASCAYKHVLAYKEIIAKNLDGALILEDDIQLDPRLFIGIFNKSLTELNRKSKNLRLFLTKILVFVLFPKVREWEAKYYILATEIVWLGLIISTKKELN